MGAAWRGALIGAGGGVAFALLLGSQFQGENGSVASLLALLKQLVVLLSMSVPAFAWIGYLGASRVFAGNEMMFQEMLRNGAHVPEHEPILNSGDRGPAIAVAIAFFLIIGCIILLWAKFW